MAYETPTSTDRGRLSAILSDKRNISGVGEVTDRGRLESILGKSAGAPLSTTIAPSRHNVAWANERYIKANTPWYVNALTKGPVGGFLNVIQKPLAFTSSALKETIDVFTGQDASWGDFKKQFNDNYTFGRLLHDYDVMQDRDSGWQKFGAAALGFIGDVALDPLSYLGLVGKGAAFSSALARKGAREVGRELVRKSALTNLSKTVGDEGMGYVARQMDNANWSALADDIAGDIAKGGKSSLKKVDDGWEWTSRTAVEEIGEDAQSLVVKFTDQEVADLERLYEIGARAQQKGATSVDGDDLRFAASKWADSGLDRAARFGDDAFTDPLRQGFRQAEQGFKGAFLTADDAAKMKLSFGMKVPFTGPVGRALRVADPIERAINKVTRKGVQAPVGMRIMTSETPILGKLVTGIPQGLRNGIIGQRGGLTRMVTKGRFAGRLPELKTAIRESSDSVFIQQGKRVIHAVARGNSKGRSTKVQLSRIANDFLNDVDEAGVDVSQMYHALAGDVNAAAGIDDALLQKGRDTFELLRVEANRAGGGADWLSFIDNYVPRQLTDEAQEAIQEAWAKSGKYSRRIHKSRGKWKPQGPELRRKYVDPDEFEAVVAARVKSEKITPDEARKLLKEEGDIADNFWGEKLNKPGSKIACDPDGRTWGSIEKQITDIIERNGGDYSLFVDDIETAMRGYVNQISKRAGEVYTESLLFSEGILIDRMAEFVKLPSSRAVQAGRRFRDAQAAWMNATSNLMEAMNRKSAGVGDQAVVDKNIEELQAVVDQAEREVLEADAIQRRYADEITRQEESYVAVQAERAEVDEQIARLTKDIEDNPDVANIVKLEEERLRLVNKSKSLAMDETSLRFAYETLGSGTAQVLFLERAITSVFKTSDNFDLFVRELGGLNPADPNADLAAFAAANELPSFLRQEGDRFIFVGEAGFESDVELLFGNMDGILQQSDEKGIGVWLGVERELDVLARQPKVEVPTTGGTDAVLTGWETGNAAYKLDWSLKRIRLDMEEATKVIDDYAEFADVDVLDIPTPDNVTTAKAGILQALDQGIADGRSLDEVLTSPDVMDLLYTYHAGSGLPARATLFDGREMSEMIQQIDEALDIQIDQYASRIQGLEDAAEAAGQPLRLVVQPPAGGEPIIMTVRDAVQLKKNLQAMQNVPTTSQIPAGPVGVSIDDILINGTLLEGPLGTNVGGKYQLGDKVYYVKQYGDEAFDPETGESFFVRNGNGRDRVTGEVLSNALYRELGLSAPASYASRASDGSIYHVSPWLDDLTTIQQSGLDPATARVYTDGNGVQFLADPTDPRVQQVDAVGIPFVEVLARGLAADVLLSNWDVLGTGFDNVGVSALDGVTRIDNGGSFFHRAQGALKENIGWNYLDPEEDIDSMLQSARFAYEDLVKGGVVDGDLTRALGNQVRELLDLRNRMGGMENFVRRHMPGLAAEEQASYVDFLESRLEALANKFNQPFFAQGSDDLIGATLAARSVPQRTIDEAIKNGTATRLLHQSNSSFLAPSLRYGSPELSWADKPSLNVTLDGMYVDNMSPYSYNLVLDTPLGAKNIKVYGVHADTEVRVAELMMRQTSIESPEDIERFAIEMHDIIKGSGRGGYLAAADPLVSSGAGHMMLDQITRVHDADPELLRKVLRVWERTAKDLPDMLSGGFAAGSLRREQISKSAAVVRMALEMGDIAIPTSAFGIDPQRAQMVQKLNSMSFEERLRFAIWMTDTSGGGQVSRRLTESQIMRPRLTDAWEKLEAVMSTVKRKEFDIKTGDVPEMLSVYLGQIDSAINPDGWAGQIAKNNFMLSRFAGGIDALLFTMQPSGTPISQLSDKAVKPQQWLFKNFYETYRRSLSADGYNATAWFNEEEITMSANALSEAVPFQGKRFSPSPQLWANMMVTNPLAVHSSDVMTTHRNISRIASDAAFDSADLSDDAARRLHNPYPDDPDMPMIIDPDDESNVLKTAGELWEDEAAAIETIIGKGSMGAAEGQTKFIDAASFLDWWDGQAQSYMGPNYQGVGPNAYQIDLMEALVDKRALLTQNLEEVSVVHAELSRKFANAVADKGRTDVNAGMSQWALDTALAQKQGQIDRAKETLARLGAPENVPLEDIPDDLVEIRLAVGALIDNDAEMLNLALDQFEEGADDWLELVSQFPEGADDLHRIPKREEALDTVFRSGFKPIGATLQGPEAIVESMVAAERYVARGGAAGFFRKYDKLHNLLRAYMIAKPGFHGRNFMSAVFMNHLSGMNWSNYRRFMRSYWKFQEEEATRLGLTDRASSMRKAMKARGINPNNVNPEHVQYIRQLSESGALGAAGGQVATEFVETGGKGIGPSVTIRGKKINLIDAMNPASSRNAPLRLSRNLGMATETFVRGSLGFDTLYKGGAVDEAFDNVMKFHFDYDDLSDFERNVVKKVIPFYTWTRKNMPLMFEMFARKPAVFNRYNSLKKEIEATTEGPPSVYPRWMQRQGAIQLPFKFEGEDMFILPDMPFKAPLELLDPALAFDKDLSVVDRVQIALGTFGTQVTPLIKAPYEWKAKQNLWKDYNFDGRYEVVPRAYAMIPGLMPLLNMGGLAAKNDQGDWAMKDYELHTMAQLLPTFTDFRRLFPDEQRYQERTLSSWMSFAFGIGLRTNTKYEQQMELISRGYEMRDEISQEKSLRGARLR